MCGAFAVVKGAAYGGIDDSRAECNGCDLRFFLCQRPIRTKVSLSEQENPKHVLTCLHRLFIAALLALYGPQAYVPPVAAPELMNTILPPRSLARKAGIAARTAVINEKKLTSKCCFHASIGMSGDVILPIGSS